MPFFYAPGNHADVATKETTTAWANRFGRSYYHFVYRNVLFLVLNAIDDPASSLTASEQVAYAQKSGSADNPGGGAGRWSTFIVPYGPSTTAQRTAGAKLKRLSTAESTPSFAAMCIITSSSSGKG